MRQWLAVKLRALADWLDPIQEVSGISIKFSKEDPILIAAKQLTTAIEYKDASGEYKRHQVYARLIKDFPLEGKRRLSQAIEASLYMEGK